MALISTEEMQELARTSRIEMTEEEAERYRQMLEGMISFASVLENVKKDSVAGIPVLRLTEAENALREDRAEEGLPRECALSLSSSTQDGFFCVPRTVGE